MADIAQQLRCERKKEQNMSNINAVKVRLKFTAFGNSRTDDALTNETVENHNLGKGAGKWTKNKLAPETFKGIKKLRGIIRQEYYRMTLPWEEGERLLTLAVKPKFDQAMVDLQKADAEEIAEMIAAYPAAVEASREMHNGTWKAEDYPSEADLAASFSMEVQTEPIPRSDHFLGTLTGEALQAAQADMEARNERRVQEAVADTWRRLIEPLKHMADKLASPEAVFRDTLVENVSDIVALIPALNLTGSSQLSSAAAEVQTILAGVSANALRENPIVRKATAEAAAAVLERFGAMGNRKFAVADSAAA